MYRPDGGVLDVLDFLRGRWGSNLESFKLTQVAIDSPPMQPCTVCLGTSRSLGLRQLATPYSVLRRVKRKFHFSFISFLCIYTVISYSAYRKQDLVEVI